MTPRELLECLKHTYDTVWSSLTIAKMVGAVYGDTSPIGYTFRRSLQKQIEDGFVLFVFPRKEPFDPNMDIGRIHLANGDIGIIHWKEHEIIEFFEIFEEYLKSTETELRLRMTSDRIMQSILAYLGTRFIELTGHPSDSPLVAFATAYTNVTDITTNIP